MGSGDSESIGANNNFYEYDPILNTWTAKTPCPLSDDGHVSFVINDLGYIGLGYGGAGLYSYNPVTNTWTLATNAIPGSWWGAAFVLDNKAYYVPCFSNTLYQYDPISGLVTTKAPFIGIGRIAAAGFSVRGKGYIGLGTTGFDGPYDLKDFYFYDPILNVWDTIPKSFPGARRHFVPCVTIGDNVYFGTGTNGTNLADFWAYEWKISVGINEYNKETDISIFPNPTTDFISINLTEEVKNISPKIQIFTGDGKEVLSQKINEAKNTFDVSNFAKGIYYISLSDETKLISTKKIIIN